MGATIANVQKSMRINSINKTKNKYALFLHNIHLKHSIFEYFLPDGFDIGSLARNISNARFISRIRVRSLSHAVFLYSKCMSMVIDLTKKGNNISINDRGSGNEKYVHTI